MNFDISSAAEIVQNVIRETLEGFPGTLNISDDILVFGKTVFRRLKERGLTLNERKCEYSKDKVEFFGYTFSGDGITPDPKKIEDITNLQTPTSASEVRSLLGMTNYCSRFILDYATKTQPLRKHTHKDQPWEWRPRHDSAVNEVKDALVKAPVTAYFDPVKDTLPPRIERWALRLQPYQLTVRYRKGDGKDYLSRHPSKQITAASREQKIAEEYVNYIVSTSTPKAMTVAEIEEATKADATLQAVYPKQSKQATGMKDLSSQA